MIGGSGERRSGLGGMETVGTAGGTDDERGQEGGEHAETGRDQLQKDGRVHHKQTERNYEEQQI